MPLADWPVDCASFVLAGNWTGQVNRLISRNENDHITEFTEFTEDFKSDESRPAGFSVISMLSVADFGDKNFFARRADLNRLYYRFPCSVRVSSVAFRDPYDRRRLRLGTVSPCPTPNHHIRSVASSADVRAANFCGSQVP